MAARFVRPLLRFTRVESSSGVVLLLAAVVALLWANLGASYERFWETPVELTLGPIHLAETLRLVVNDGLMTVFFLVVGLEIKRELVTGELSQPRAAALPAIAALGGMAVPAAIYLLVTAGSGAEEGWAIPMATDIAFALGVVALLGSRVPLSGRLFLLALAITDDIGAILVIAVVYTAQLAAGKLLLALACLLAIWLAGRAGIRSLLFFLPVSLAAWYFMLESGVHATLAGVAIGLLAPARAKSGDSPLDKVERALHPWSSFVIVPLFALANAGVAIDAVTVGEAFTSPIALGVGVGLVIGKFVGITGFAWMAVRLRLGVLPDTVRWAHIAGLALVAGIGFTVSLFITGLAFDDPANADLAKLGIFAGSVVSGVLGFLVLRSLRAEPPRGEPG